MLTASIVTYHTSRTELEQCFNSLASCDCISKLYVVDNGREKRIQELSEKAPLFTEYIPLDNPGYGAAHNVAIAKASTLGANYHLVLNTDVKFGGEVIPALLEYLESHEDTGMVQPRIINAEGQLEPTARLVPTPFDLILRRFLPSGIFTKRRKLYLLSHIDHTQQFNAPYLEGSFMLMRMEALEQTGGFDERFFMYPEDIDLTRRMHRYWRTVYCPIVQITHLHKRASYTSMRMLWTHCTNMIKYFNKWGWIIDAERKKFNKPFLDKLAQQKRRVL